MDDLSFKQVAGTALSGTVGFVVGFYAGFFLILSIFGLEFESFLFPVVTGVLGSLIAGGAMALTVRSEARVRAVVSTLILGVAMVAIVATANADVGALAIGGLIVVTISAVVTRSGSNKPVGT